jgi:hypothetical protein
MTRNESKDQLPGAEQVSRAYGAANFDEQPPASIDRAIINAARQQHRGRFSSYLPPLALAATVVLSVSLIFRSGVLNENTEIFSEPARAPAASTLPSPEATEFDDAADSEELAPLQDSPALLRGAGTADTLEQVLVPPEESAGADDTLATEPRTRQVQPGLLEEVAQEQQAADAISLESAATTAGVAGFAQTSCSDDYREGPESWLECIEVILATGDENAARDELAAFVELNSDYALPANLEAILAR